MQLQRAIPLPVNLPLELDSPLTHSALSSWPKGFLLSPAAGERLGRCQNGRRWPEFLLSPAAGERLGEGWFGFSAAGGSAFGGKGAMHKENGLWGSRLSPLLQGARKMLKRFPTNPFHV